MEALKKERASRKSVLTRCINDLHRFIVDEDREKAKDRFDTIKERFCRFEEAHDAFHNTLNEEDDIEKSDEYFTAMHKNYVTVVKEAREWLKLQEKQEPVQKTEKKDNSSSSELLKCMNLPKIELDFDGDPLSYHSFIALFNENIHEVVSDDDIRLSRLIQFTSGDANKAIRSCAVLGGSGGYKKARDILKTRFGDEFLIAEKVISQLKSGKPIWSATELQQFSDELQNAFTTLSSINRLVEVDVQSCISEIASRVQPEVKNRWKRHMYDIKEKKRRYPNFEEFVSFIGKEASEMNDPVWGQWGKYSRDKSRSQSNDKPKSLPSSKTFAASTESSNSKKRSPCILCKHDHRLFYCDMFKSMKVPERIKLVKDNNLCENCLLNNHKTADCRKMTRCTVDGCNEKHTKFIHVNKSSQRAQSSDVRPVTNASVNVDGDVLLPVVPISVNDKCDTHALLDSGSTSTFCTQDLVNELELQGHDVKYRLRTLNKEANVCTKSVSLKVASRDGRDVLNLSDVFVVPEIPVSVPVVDLKKYPHLCDIPLCQEVAHVKLLIGQDNAEALVPIQLERGGKGEPFAVRTLFGWSLNGPISSSGPAGKHVVNNFISCHVNVSHDLLEDKISELWKVENEGLSDEKEAWSEDDRQVVKLWDAKVAFQDGHYVLPIPWREHAYFPDNVSLAMSRLQSLRRSLDKRGLFEKYNAEILKLLSSNYAEKVDLAVPPGDKIWYLPHQAVLSSNKPGKVRVVFDCAAKYDSESLNHKCLRGPDLNNRLLAVILRFRQHEFAFMGDVEAMYYQVKVPTHERDALRFLWFNADGGIDHFRMTCHVFGGVWCSCAATYALRRVLVDVPDVDSAVASALRHSFYVDDCLVSVRSEEEVLHVQTGLKELLAKTGFNLTKFVVNRNSILEWINEADRATEVKTRISESSCKALGIVWNVSSDEFQFEVDFAVPKVVTRRSILSVISSTFDPLGLIGPILVVGKILFQKVTKMKLSWDENVPPDIRKEWESWLLSLRGLSEIKIKRCVKTSEFNDAYLELHHFSDASLKAYGCCSYLRCINKDGKISTYLLVSKCKVAPINAVSIPRLELQAAVLSAKIDVWLKEELHDLEISNSIFWSDSQIVLQYIKSETRGFKIYVANRVGTIRSLTDVSKWFHVSGKANPADIISRGKTPALLDTDMWFQGPPFLRLYKAQWHTCPDVGEIPTDDPELLKCEKVSHVAAMVNDHPLDKLSEHYSDWYRLKRAVAWLLRLRDLLRGENKDKIGSNLSVDELKAAELSIVKRVQSQVYEVEIRRLQAGDSIEKSSSLKDLCPILNHDGVLCVGGRFNFSDVQGLQRNPAIIPNKHHIAELIVRDVHQVAHLGVEWTLGRLRTRYWVVKARVLIKRILRACVTCKHLFGLPCSQKMADLPRERLEANKPPFSYIGIDCFGPFTVKCRRSQVKRYGCLLTCFTTRAVHLEVLESLETQAFLNGFRRFVARRGSPLKVWTDRGTNFIGANAELKRGLKELDESALQSYGVQREIEWNFNPPMSSNMGGVWERCIRTVRKVIAGIMKDTHLSDDSLHTLFCEVESIVNSRPITKVSDSLNDMSALTPNHLLLLRQGPVPPPGVFSSTDAYRRRWKHVQFLVSQFWKKWLNEYLPELQRRQKWQNQTRNLQIGDVVLIVGENTPRSVWPLALVVKVHESKDGLVRSADVRTRTTVLTRPITKLVLLEGSN